MRWQCLKANNNRACVQSQAMERNIGNCLRFKMRVALCSAMAAACLLLLYALSRQTVALVSEGGGQVAASFRHRRALEVDPPRVFSERQLAAFLELLQRGYLRDFHQTHLGSWAARRGLNNLATLDSGGGEEHVMMKQRRRYNLQSELFSYYLNCYLGLWNAPPTAARCLDAERDGKLVLTGAPAAPLSFDTENSNTTNCFIVTAYVNNIQDKVYIPTNTLSLGSASNSGREMHRLLECSDLIVFDFLIGHTDRLLDSNIKLLSHLDFIVPTYISNLARVSSGELLLIDHEATFHSSYVKSSPGSLRHRRQLYYLGTVSVFRRQTLERVCELCRENDPASTLEEYIGQHDPVSLEVASKLEPQDRAQFKERLLHVCSNTCHLLQHRTQVYV